MPVGKRWREEEKRGEARRDSAVWPVSAAEEPNDLHILLLLLLFPGALLPSLSPHVHHVFSFNNRLEHVSHVLQCAGMHAGSVYVCKNCVCVCVYSINQVSVVDVERGGLVGWCNHAAHLSNISDHFSKSVIKLYKAAVERFHITLI